MGFTLELLKSFKDSGKEICIYSDELISLLKDMSPGDFRDFSSRSYYFWRSKKRPIPLSVVLKIMKSQRIKSIGIELFSINSGNKMKFPKAEDDKFCYLLGIILGDGCLKHSARGKRNTWSVQITSNSFEKIELLKKMCYGLFGVTASVYDYETYYNLHLFSKPLVMVLNGRYGIPVGLKYSSLKVPEIVLKKANWKKAFVKGVFESDGNIYDYRGRKSVQLRQKSKKFLDEIRQVCATLGISFNRPYYDKANNSWVLWTCKNEVVGNFINKIIDFKIKAL